MTLTLPRALGDQVKVSFTDSGDLTELIALSEARSYDLFILILNNLLSRDQDHTGSRLDRGIKVVERIKSRGNAKVIALSCYFETPDFPDRVRRAGADYFLTLPYEHADLGAASTWNPPNASC